MEPTKIVLTDLNVIFFNLEDEGFGLSVTVDATDQKVQDTISKWYEVNAIGKESDPNKGKPKFKEYVNEKSGQKSQQFTFKYNDMTKFAGLNGLSKKDIGFGSVIDIVANAFTFDNKFGKGVGQSLSAVLVKSAGKTGADSDVSFLLQSVPTTDAPAF